MTIDELKDSHRHLIAILRSRAEEILKHAFLESDRSEQLREERGLDVRMPDTEKLVSFPAAELDVLKFLRLNKSRKEAFPPDFGESE